MIAGDSKTALSNPNSIILTELAAEKYFGETNPLGKELVLNKKTTVTVTGILKDIKRTSTIRFNFLVSLETARSMFKDTDSWEINRHTAFVRIPEKINKVNFLMSI